MAKASWKKCENYLDLLTTSDMSVRLFWLIQTHADKFYYQCPVCVVIKTI